MIYLHGLLTVSEFHCSSGPTSGLTGQIFRPLKSMRCSHVPLIISVHGWAASSTATTTRTHSWVTAFQMDWIYCLMGCLKMSFTIALPFQCSIEAKATILMLGIFCKATCQSTTSQLQTQIRPITQSSTRLWACQWTRLTLPIPSRTTWVWPRWSLRTIGTMATGRRNSLRHTLWISFCKRMQRMPTNMGLSIPITLHLITPTLCRGI